MNFIGEKFQVTTLNVATSGAGKTTVIMDENQRMIGVAGKDIADLTKSYEVVRATLEADLGINLDATLTNAECRARVSIETGKIPREAINRFCHAGEKLEQVSQIMGEEFSLASVKLIPRHRAPKDSNWSVVTIEPLWANPARYYVEATYRGTSLEALNVFVTEATEKVVELVTIVETE